MNIFALFVNLILQCEVEMKSLHSLAMEDLDVRLIFLKLKVLDLVRKPSSQPIVAAQWKINEL